MCSIFFKVYRTVLDFKMFVGRLSVKQYDRRMVGFYKNSYILPQATIPS